MNSPPPFTLRIRNEQDQDIDWMVQPGEITFHQALEVISKTIPHATITAFQYDDEDGDKITVRSDEELKAMFELYFDVLSEEDKARGLLPPLVIYPRVGKSAKDRNIHGLSIKTQNPAVAKNGSRVSKPQETLKVQTHAQTQQGPAHPAGDIKNILACGSIRESDLQFINLLGSGNGGKVYRVLHTPTRRQMAVKVMELDVNVDEQKKILSELEILYKCNSASIIGFYGAFFIENRISICTEFMDGGSLDRYGQVPEQVLGRMAVLIVHGLLYMWSLKILHRDIKPSNILVNTGGEVKLCDFGVSKQLVVSIAKTYVGTNAYMAPERIKGEAYSTPSEVWSLGVTLFELATGQFPFKSIAANSSAIQMFNSILEEIVPVLPEGIFSPACRDFVVRCMQKHPNDRPKLTDLEMHPFIQQYNDGNRSIIASWIQSVLPRIQQASASS